MAVTASPFIVALTALSIVPLACAQAVEALGDATPSHARFSPSADVDGLLSGVLSWRSAQDETHIGAYDVMFSTSESPNDRITTVNHVQGNWIVPKDPSGVYSVHMNKYPIPFNAKYLLIFGGFPGQNEPATVSLDPQERKRQAEAEEEVQSATSTHEVEDLVQVGPALTDLMKDDVVSRDEQVTQMMQGHKNKDLAVVKEKEEGTRQRKKSKAESAATVSEENLPAVKDSNGFVNMDRTPVSAEDTAGDTADTTVVEESTPTAEEIPEDPRVQDGLKSLNDLAKKPSKQPGAGINLAQATRGSRPSFGKKLPLSGVALTKPPVATAPDVPTLISPAEEEREHVPVKVLPSSHVQQMPRFKVEEEEETEVDPLFEGSNVTIDETVDNTRVTLTFEDSDYQPQEFELMWARDLEHHKVKGKIDFEPAIEQENPTRPVEGYEVWWGSECEYNHRIKGPKPESVVGYIMRFNRDHNQNHYGRVFDDRVIPVGARYIMIASIDKDGLPMCYPVCKGPVLPSTPKAGTVEPNTTMTGEYTMEDPNSAPGAEHIGRAANLLQENGKDQDESTQRRLQLPLEEAKTDTDQTPNFVPRPVPVPVVVGVPPVVVGDPSEPFVPKPFVPETGMTPGGVPFVPAHGFGSYEIWSASMSASPSPIPVPSQSASISVSPVPHLPNVYGKDGSLNCFSTVRAPRDLELQTHGVKHGKFTGFLAFLPSEMYQDADFYTVVFASACNMKSLTQPLIKGVHLQVDTTVHYTYYTHTFVDVHVPHNSRVVMVVATRGNGTHIPMGDPKCMPLTGGRCPQDGGDVTPPSQCATPETWTYTPKYAAFYTPGPMDGALSGVLEFDDVVEDPLAPDGAPVVTQFYVRPSRDCTASGVIKAHGVDHDFAQWDRVDTQTAYTTTLSNVYIPSATRYLLIFAANDDGVPLGAPAAVSVYGTVPDKPGVLSPEFSLADLQATTLDAREKAATGITESIPALLKEKLAEKLYTFVVMRINADDIATYTSSESRQKAMQTLLQMRMGSGYGEETLLEMGESDDTTADLKVTTESGAGAEFVPGPKRGCTVKYASNYDPEAIVDDSSCKFKRGCTMPNAVNYDPDAVIDDGSCQLTPIVTDVPDGHCGPEGCFPGPNPDLPTPEPVPRVPAEQSDDNMTVADDVPIIDLNGTNETNANATVDTDDTADGDFDNDAVEVMDTNSSIDSNSSNGTAIAAPEEFMMTGNVQLFGVAATVWNYLDRYTPFQLWVRRVKAQEVMYSKEDAAYYLMISTDLVDLNNTVAILDAITTDDVANGTERIAAMNLVQVAGLMEPVEDVGRDVSIVDQQAGAMNAMQMSVETTPPAAGGPQRHSRPQVSQKHYGKPATGTEVASKGTHKGRDDRLPRREGSARQRVEIGQAVANKDDSAFKGVKAAPDHGGFGTGRHHFGRSVAVPRAVPESEEGFISSIMKHLRLA